MEWSTDGRSFTSLAAVREASVFQGNNTGYGYDDHYPAEGSNYYRIRQVDFSGEYSFSSIRRVEFDGAGNDDGFMAYPNPASDEVELYFPLGFTDGPVQIFSLNGTKIRTVKAFEGARVTVKISDLPRGVYLIRNGDHTARLVKQ